MPRGRPRKKQSSPDRIQSAELIGLGAGRNRAGNCRRRATRLAALMAQAEPSPASCRARVALSGAVAATRSVRRHAGTEGQTPPRKLSAEARKKISERMTKRWAEWRKKHSK